MWKCIVWKVGFAKKFFQENFVFQKMDLLKNFGNDILVYTNTLIFE
jgi:hypothetical protein